MRVWLALLTLATTVAWPAAARAFCRTTTCASTPPPSYCARDQQGCWVQGAPLFWEQGCVSYAVNEVGVPPLGLDWTGLQSIADQAFNVWLTADCLGQPPTLRVQSLGPVPCNRAEYNPGGPNVNLIVFHTGAWPHDNGYLTYGLTTVTFDVDSGRLLGADLELNGANQTFTRDELAYVMAHEAGHFLGIDHNRDNAEALMYGSYSFHGAPATLIDDDREAICTIYPPGRPMPPCKFEPTGGLARDCGGDVYGSCGVAAPGAPGGRSTLPALALLGALALLTGARRRRAALG